MEVDELSDLDPGFLVDAGVDSFELPTEQPKYIRNNRNRTNVTRLKLKQQYADTYICLQRKQRKLHSYTFKVTIMSVPVNPKQKLHG
jgi:hypothetical protein